MQAQENSPLASNDIMANLKAQVADLQVSLMNMETTVESLRVDKKFLLKAVNSLTLITNAIMRKAVLVWSHNRPS